MLTRDDYCQPLPATAVDYWQMLSNACVVKQKPCRLCPITTVTPRMWLLQVDLLPKGTDTAAVTEWLLATAGHRRLNVVNAHLVGSPAGQGISEVASAILRDRKGRSVYVLGAANVGKSSFIRALVRQAFCLVVQCLPSCKKTLKEHDFSAHSLWAFSFPSRCLQPIPNT